jgi:xylulokinase
VIGSPLVLGIDLGTTGIKAVLLDTVSGRTVREAYRTYPSHTDDGGRHEQEPDEWWRACSVVTREVLVDAVPSRVAAVGLSGHMHGVVLVDADDRYLRRAMTWADRRNVEQVTQLRQTAGERFHEKCANPVVEAFTAPKVAWLALYEPASLQQAVRLVQPKDSLRHRLTGTWGTDLTDARGTLLYDVHAERWDEELWAMCGAAPGLGPAVSPSTQVVGHITEAAAATTGLAAGTPVVAGAGDVASSALGAGLVAEGMVYVNAGTAAQVTTPTKDPVPGNHFVFGRADSHGYHLMASVYAAGLAVDWAARTIIASTSHAEHPGRTLDAIARGEPPGARGVVFVPHLLGTSVPTHDPHMGGALLGIRPDHRPATVARAVLEGVAYACAAAARYVSAVQGSASRIHLGGGLSRSTVWCDALAAVADVPVYRVQGDASVRGAAMLAGMGVGIWSDASEAAAVCVHVDEVPRGTDSSADAHRRAQKDYELAVMTLSELNRRTGDTYEAQPDGS